MANWNILRFMLSIQISHQKTNLQLALMDFPEPSLLPELIVNNTNLAYAEGAGYTTTTTVNSEFLPPS